MTYVADLHTHAAYARGTSRQLTFENLSRWAKLKGIDLLATGDFTHPRWLHETRSRLRESSGGLMELDGVHFVLGTEVNSINDEGRRVHLLLFAPDLGAVERINAAFATRGNLASDGRPTLHLSPRDVVRTLLDIDERCLVVPAHLWTPWFGAYGSKSGFDSLEECFGDMAGHIHAVETGLSSDPAMNWRVPSLDGLSIVSFSDAHSLPNLGRELTVFEGELSYAGLVQALKTQRVAYTVEFFPEEGKYHHSGHRKCGVRYSPEDVATNGAACPVCGRRMTLGVMQRVDELARRDVETWVDGDGFVRGEDGAPAVQEPGGAAPDHSGEPGVWAQHQEGTDRLRQPGVALWLRARRLDRCAVVRHRRRQQRPCGGGRLQSTKRRHLHRARLRRPVRHREHLGRCGRCQPLSVLKLSPPAIYKTWWCASKNDE